MQSLPSRISFGRMPHKHFDDFCTLLSSVLVQDGADGRHDALIGWSPEQWEAAIALASRHLVLPSVAAQLSKNHAANVFDHELIAFFKKLHAGNIQRNHKIVQQTLNACGLANNLGIQPILLKGAALLGDDVYGDIGARYLSDIDILVDRADRDKLQQAMVERGYQALPPQNQALKRQGLSFWDNHRHAPPMFDPEGEVLIEIHSDTLSVDSEALDLGYSSLAARALKRQRGEVQFRLPSIQDRIVHCIAHNQLGHNERFIGAIEMRDLLDLHFLTKCGPCSDEDWANVHRRFDRAGYGSLVIGFLRALKTMVPNAALGPCQTGGIKAWVKQSHYLRRNRQSRLIDPTVYSDIMAREWHRVSAFKTYRQQLRINLVEAGYWRHRWNNLLKVIRGH